MKIIKRMSIVFILCMACFSLQACESSNQASISEHEIYLEKDSDVVETDSEVLAAEAESHLFTEDEIGTIDPEDESNLGEINGELVDEDYAQNIEQDLEELQNNKLGGDLELPQGYPSDLVPIMKNAVLIDSSTYADNGYIIIYEIDEALDTVNEFYYDIINQDPLSKTEDDIYYENVQLNHIVIAGLTLEYIEDNKTNVYLTVFDENDK